MQESLLFGGSLGTVLWLLAIAGSIVASEINSDCK